MANTFSAVVSLTCNALVELDDAILPAFGERSLRFSGFSSNNVLEAGDVIFVYAATFTSGTTLDLTALQDNLFGTQDLTGETLQAILVNNNSSTPTPEPSPSPTPEPSPSPTPEPSPSPTPENNLTIAGSYPILGGTLVVPPGGKLLLYKPTTTAVSSSYKTITFSGSTSYEVMLIF